MSSITEFFHFVKVWSQAAVIEDVFFIIMNVKFVCFQAVVCVSLLFMCSGFGVNEL